MSVIHTPRKPVLDARMLLFPLVLLAIFVVLFLRLWYLQVVKSAELAEKAERYRYSQSHELAPRGLIFDRAGVLLAGVQSEVVITAIPAEVRKNEWVLAKTAEILETDEKRLKDRADAGYWRPYLPTPIYIGAPIEAATRIAESWKDLPGIGVENLPIRYYPDSFSFTHILGYTLVPDEQDTERVEKMGRKAPEYVGKTGLEFVYEQDLMGYPGGLKVQVDARRRPTKIVSHDNATPGNQLILNLSADLQKLGMELMKDRVGAIVAVDPNDGGVLCMVSSPSYDQRLFKGGISSKNWNMLQDDPDVPLINRAINGHHAPGSTFKIVVALAAARAGKFDPDYAVNCPGYFQIGRRKVRCLGRHGRITFHRALQKSCNTYFAEMATRVGPDILRQTALDVGLGKETGIDLRGERAGIVPTDEWIKRWRESGQWYEGDTVNLGIGQGELSVSALQMADVMAFVANEGYAYKPHLVRSIREARSEELQPFKLEEAARFDLPATFWADLKEAMHAVTIPGGTAARSRIPGINWAGKTGSAEHTGSNKTHSWFVAFAPLEDPQIAICVMVEAGGHGSEIAAPIASKIVHKYLSPETFDEDKIYDLFPREQQSRPEVHVEPEPAPEPDVPAQAGDLAHTP